MINHVALLSAATVLAWSSSVKMASGMTTVQAQHTAAAPTPTNDASYSIKECLTKNNFDVDKSYGIYKEAISYGSYSDALKCAMFTTMIADYRSIDDDNIDRMRDALPLLTVLRNANTLHIVEDIENRCSDSDSATISLEVPIMPVRYGKNCSIFLFDTGATFSVVSGSVKEGVQSVEVENIGGESISVQVGVLPEIEYSNLTLDNAVVFVQDSPSIPLFGIHDIRRTPWYYNHASNAFTALNRDIVDVQSNNKFVFVPIKFDGSQLSINVTIDRTVHSCMLDTGLSISILPTDLQVSSSDQNPTALTTLGHGADVPGYLMGGATVHLGGASFAIPRHIASTDAISECIIGWDVLKQNSFILDIDSRNIRFKL